MFPNTSIPHRPTQPGRLQIPQRRHNGNGPLEYYLTPELEAEFRKRYPVTFNAELMTLFGIGSSTLHRFARSLGLEKKMKVIQRKQTALTKKICEENGYYDSIRGRRPSEACIEATKQMWAEGFHPMKALKKKNPRKYKRSIARKSAQRKELEEEIARYNRWGIDHPSSIADYRPQIKFTKTQICHRSECLKRGYILGDRRENSGERYNIYYDHTTVRSPIFERNLEADHFRVLPIRARARDSKTTRRY